MMAQRMFNEAIQAEPIGYTDFTVKEELPYGTFVTDCLCITKKAKDGMYYHMFQYTFDSMPFEVIKSVDEAYDSRENYISIDTDVMNKFVDGAFNERENYTATNSDPMNKIMSKFNKIARGKSIPKVINAYIGGEKVSFDAFLRFATIWKYRKANKENQVPRIVGYFPVQRINWKNLGIGINKESGLQEIVRLR